MIKEKKCLCLQPISIDLDGLEYCALFSEAAHMPNTRQFSLMFTDTDREILRRIRAKFMFLQVSVCLSTGGGGDPTIPCRSHDQPAVYKQLHCCWLSVGVETAYMKHQMMG